MRAVLVAHDTAPSIAFEKLFDKLAKEEARVTTYLDHGNVSHYSFTEISEIRKYADVVLCGMSSSKQLASPEIIAAHEAGRANIPFGFYADTFGCAGRSWFEALCDSASFVFVINQREAEGAKLQFPNAEIVVSGNPEWEEFCFPKYSREQVRDRLKVREDEIFVLSPGHKSPVITAFLWGSVVEALVLSGMDHRKWRLFLSPHPGDQYAPAVYNDFINYCSLSVCVVPNDVMTTVDMIPGCDIFINSASTTGIAAHFQRKQVIDYFGEVALSRNETVFGTRIWEPCKMGASIDVYGNIQELSRTINLFINEPTDYVKILKKKILAEQEKHFPLITERGTAVRIMADTLRRFGTDTDALCLKA